MSWHAARRSQHTAVVFKTFPELDMLFARRTHLSSRIYCSSVVAEAMTPPYRQIAALCAIRLHSTFKDTKACIELLQIEGQAVVGATLEGNLGFQVWYCSSPGKGHNKPVR